MIASIRIDVMNEFFSRLKELMAEKDVPAWKEIVLSFYGKKEDTEHRLAITASVDNITLRTVVKGGRKGFKASVVEEGSLGMVIKNLSGNFNRHSSCWQDRREFTSIHEKLFKDYRRDNGLEETSYMGNYRFEIVTLPAVPCAEFLWSETHKFKNFNFDLSDHKDAAFMIPYSTTSINLDTFIKHLKRIDKKGSRKATFYLYVKGEHSFTVRCSSLKFGKINIYIDQSFPVERKIGYDTYPVTGEWLFLIEKMVAKKKPIWMVWYKDTGWVIQSDGYWLNIR